MESKIKLKDSQGQLLYEYPVEKHEAAYSKAQELENMGIEVIMDSPSLPETLGATLGMSNSEREKLKTEIEDEIESHNEKPTCGGCE